MTCQSNRLHPHRLFPSLVQSPRPSSALVELHSFSSPLSSSATAWWRSLGPTAIVGRGGSRCGIVHGGPVCCTSGTGHNRLGMHVWLISITQMSQYGYRPHLPHWKRWVLQCSTQQPPHMPLAGSAQSVLLQGAGLPQLKTYLVTLGPAESQLAQLLITGRLPSSPSGALGCIAYCHDRFTRKPGECTRLQIHCCE
jgi:hypothetical protein